MPLTFSNSAMKLLRDSSLSLPTSNMVTAWLFRPGDRFPIIRNAVKVESNRKAILLECPTLIKLDDSETETDITIPNGVTK